MKRANRIQAHTEIAALDWRLKAPPIDTYGHVMDELDHAPTLAAVDAVMQARSGPPPCNSLVAEQKRADDSGELPRFVRCDHLAQPCVDNRSVAAEQRRDGCVQQIPWFP